MPYLSYYHILIARYEFGIIITLMSLSWGAVAGAFMAPYLYGLFWKRTTLAGVYAGMITGLVVSIGLFFYLGAEKVCRCIQFRNDHPIFYCTTGECIN